MYCIQLNIFSIIKTCFNNNSGKHLILFIARLLLFLNLTWTDDMEVTNQIISLSRQVGTCSEVYNSIRQVNLNHVFKIEKKCTLLTGFIINTYRRVRSMFFYTLMSKDVNNILKFRQNLQMLKLIVPSLRKIKI